MWRLANYIYRAFRNVATHRCSQDTIAPFTTVHNKDDESNHEEKEDKSVEYKTDIDQIIKTNQFSSRNFEKLQEQLCKISFHQFIYKPKVIKPIVPPKIECIVQEVQQSPVPHPIQKEDTLDSLLQADETCRNTLKTLSELHEETMSIIDNQLALEAIEAGNVQLGIETLQASAKSGKNVAALYNLGICYERGIGVKEDRAKACDYYRRAAALGHIHAQFNLTLLSNHIDVNDHEEDRTEENIPNKRRVLRFSFAKEYKEEQSWNDYSMNFTSTLACLP